MSQCSFQKVFVATRIFSLPLDSGSFSWMVTNHLTARATRATLSITSGESRIMTVPSGRNIRSISTIKSTRLHLQWIRDDEHVHFIYKINGHLKIKYLAEIENRVPIQAQVLDDHKHQTGNYFEKQYKLRGTRKDLTNQIEETVTQINYSSP